MAAKRLVYLMSLRNAAADQAGQWVMCRGQRCYMKSPLEYLVEQLEQTALGRYYTLEGVIYDDVPGHARDMEKVRGYGFAPGEGEHWICPPDMQVQGRALRDLMENLPSSYRALPAADVAGRAAGKAEFERRLEARLLALQADLVVVDGLILILDALVRPGAVFHDRVFNIHPGITRADSPYERRGATATFDALYGARGQKVLNWQTMESRPVTPLYRTGASFHVVDGGIDSGPVLWDVLATPIGADDTILELRWKNFHQSLFPALSQGLALLAGMPGRNH